MVYYTASNPNKKKLTAHITTSVLGAYCFYLVDLGYLIWEGALQFNSRVDLQTKAQADVLPSFTIFL